MSSSSSRAGPSGAGSRSTRAYAVGPSPATSPSASAALVGCRGARAHRLAGEERAFELDRCREDRDLLEAMTEHRRRGRRDRSRRPRRCRRGTAGRAPCGGSAWSSDTAAATASAPTTRRTPRDPAPTDGFTTTPAGSSRSMTRPGRSSGSTNSLGTTGTPRAARSARYRLSTLPSIDVSGFHRLVTSSTLAAHARKSSSRST